MNVPMDQLVEWFVMGGYAWYVWPSYIAGLLVLILNVWLPLRTHHRLLKRHADMMHDTF